jgi:hypothetical protein
VGPRAGLDRCGKSRPHRDSISGPSSPYPVTITTELPGPQILIKFHKNLILSIAVIITETTNASCVTNKRTTVLMI